GEWDLTISSTGVDAVDEAGGGRPDASLRADGATWARIAADLRGGMNAFRSGRLSVRHDLGLAVGFLAATNGSREPGRLRFRRGVREGLELERTHLRGHSLGGRVAIETAIGTPDRFDRLVLLTPSMAWLRKPPWANFIKLLRPELGLVQPAPRPIVEGIVRRF